MGVVDVLLNGNVIPVYEVVVEKSESRALDRAIFKAQRTQSVALGDDVRVRSGTVYLFGGKVVDIRDYYDMREVTALSYAKTLEERRVFPPKMYVNQRPEQIVADLIATYTNLTFSSTTYNSGITIARYKAGGSVGEIIREMASIAGADFWSDVDSNGVARFYFQPASGRNLNVTLITGGANANARRIEYNSGELEIINAAEVYGKAKQRLEQLRWHVYSTITGGGYLVIPVELANHQLQIRQQTLSEPGEYEYILSNEGASWLKINVSVSGTETNPAPVIVNAQVDTTRVSYKENAGSIATWGKRHRVFMTEMDDQAALDQLASKIVSLYGSPRRSLRVEVPGIRTDIKDGGYVTVTDPYLGITNQTFVVKKVTWKYPKGVTELELGQFIPELYEFERKMPKLVESASRKYSLELSKKRLLRLYFGANNYLGETNTATPDAVTVNIGGPYSWVEWSLDVKLTNTSNQSTTYTNRKFAYIPPTGSSIITAYATPDSIWPTTGFADPLRMEVRVFWRVPFQTRQQLGTDVYTYNFESGVKRLLFSPPMWSFETRYDSSTGDLYFYRGAGRNTFLANIGIEYV